MIAYFEDILDTIRASIRSLNEDDFIRLVENCVDKVQNGGKVIASGLGKNVPICEKFVGTLNSFGINAAFLHTNTAIHGDLGIIHPGDIVILLSKSGSTEESIMLAQYLLKRQTDTWFISFGDGGRLSGILENKVILELPHEGDRWNIVPNNSTSIYLILLQGLAMRVSERLEVTIEQFKTNHPGGSIGEILSVHDRKFFECEVNVER